MCTRTEQGEVYAELLAAVESGDAAATRLCLSRGASPRGPRKFFRRVNTPLACAARAGRVEIVALLLEAGADAEGKARGRYPIELASGAGHVDVVALLLEAGVQMHDAVCLAAAYGNLGVLELLLERGAKPQVALKGGLGSQLRMQGRILRRLRDAGGVLEPEIERIVQEGTALGDELDPR